MIPSSSRLFQCAALLVTLLGADASFAQSAIADPTLASELNLTSTLPDSPSFSTSLDSSLKVPAQAQSAPPQNETPQERKARERQEADRQIKAEEKQRIGGIIPNFNVSMGGPFVPLSPRQKLSLSFHTIIDPYSFGLALIVGGGFGEIEDDHTGYGHGPEGYFLRSAASYADNVNGNLIGNALLPIVLHQDPRYFRKGQGPLVKRIVYSALTTFICKGDNGKDQFNLSNVAGNFVSGAISNAYYPDDERGVGLTLTNALVVTLEGMVGAQLLEFSPDIANYVQNRREKRRMLIQQKIDASAAANMATPPATKP